MPSKPRDRIGEVYGRLTVVRTSERRTSAGNSYWWCECSCGNEREVASDSLSNQQRKKKSVTECLECAKELAIEGVCLKNDKEEAQRLNQSLINRQNLNGQVPAEWLKLALTDADARRRGEKLFFRGTRCLNDHLSPYRINGGCLECAGQRKKELSNDY